MGYRPRYVRVGTERWESHMDIAEAHDTCSLARTRNTVRSTFFFFCLWVTCCIVGPEHLSTYLKVYKVGDIIDIKVRIYAVHRLT